MKVKIEKVNEIIGALKITPSVHDDTRGKIWTTYDQTLCNELNLKFNHDKFSVSSSNVLRGIHGDMYTTKLVTCINGSILQAIVDLRPTSATFGSHFICEIDSKKPTLLLIPKGCGNAFYTKCENAIYHYKLSYSGHYKDYDEQFTVKWNDPELAINWRLEKDPLISARDEKGMSFADYKKR